MLQKFFQNTRKPAGFLGRLVLRTMNGGHTPLSNWGLSLIDPAQDARALDAAFNAMRQNAPDYPMPAFDALRAAMPDWQTLHRLYNEKASNAKERERT